MTALSFNVSQDQPGFDELVTFLDFAEGFTIGFVEVNVAADADVLIELLRQDLACAELRFEVFQFSHQPNLRFLLDELRIRFANAALVDASQQKQILILCGLEAAIATDAIGAYPPILQDLNFVRDAYRTSVPYPVLFVLPDYAITRVAKYAPDFWDWRSGVFVFKADS